MELIPIGLLILATIAAGVAPDVWTYATTKRQSPSIDHSGDTESDEAFTPINEQYNAAEGVDAVMIALRRAVNSRNFDEAKGLLDIAIKLKGPASE